MRFEETKRRQIQLNKFIRKLTLELINSKDKLRNLSLELTDIYSEDFRHSYSEFFTVIDELNADKAHPQSLDILSDNLDAIRLHIHEDFENGTKDFDKIYVKSEKLFDHLNLEISRMNFYLKNDEKIEDIDKKHKDLNSSLNETINEMNKAKDSLDKASQKASAIQTELIAVLSIFAAIVITFSGSISFVGNVMVNMASTSIFKLIFILLILGIVLFNAIFLMLYLISRIIDRNIYAKCKTENCTCKNNTEPKCIGITRIRKRLPYIFYFNFLLSLLIVVDLTVWAIYFFA